MVHKFCEDIGLYWATQVVTVYNINKLDLKHSKAEISYDIG